MRGRKEDFWLLVTKDRLYGNIPNYSFLISTSLSLASLTTDAKFYFSFLQAYRYIKATTISLLFLLLDSILCSTGCDPVPYFAANVQKLSALALTYPSTRKPC